MLRVKMLRGNETCIIDNGKSYIFGLNGKCKQEDAGNLSSYMTGALELPCISVLSSNGGVEIALNESDSSFRRFKCNEDAMTCAMKVQMNGSFIKMLRRDGKFEDVPFNQLIFVYPQGTNLFQFISQINKEEVFD